VGAPGPSHLGTRETANPNRTIPEFLPFRLCHRPLGSYHFIDIYLPSIQRLRDLTGGILGRSSDFLGKAPRVSIFFFFAATEPGAQFACPQIWEQPKGLRIRLVMLVTIWPEL
jgi:hypothetical protein